MAGVDDGHILSAKASCRGPGEREGPWKASEPEWPERDPSPDGGRPEGTTKEPKDATETPRERTALRADEEAGPQEKRKTGKQA